MDHLLQGFLCLCYSGHKLHMCLATFVDSHHVSDCQLTAVQALATGYHGDMPSGEAHMALVITLCQGTQSSLQIPLIASGTLNEIFVHLC